jgi:hypothetical protein
MPRGRIPKDKLSRARDTRRREAEMIEVEDTGELAGPALPEAVLPDGAVWHAQTRALWAELRRSPLMQHEPNLTWQFMIDTAALHSLMWSNARWDLAPELRLRLAKIGIAPEDRQRLKLRITQPASQAPNNSRPAGVTEIAGRRTRLTT